MRNKKGHCPLKMAVSFFGRSNCGEVIRCRSVQRMQIVDIRLTKLLFRVHKPDKSEGRDLYSLCVSLNSCEKICISTVLFVDPGYLILIAEIVDADQLSSEVSLTRARRALSHVSTVCAGTSGANTGWLARMDSSCSRLLKMRP